MLSPARRGSIHVESKRLWPSRRKRWPRYDLAGVDFRTAVYADRMKRALAEDEPTIFGGDPDAFAARLAYEQRDIEEELQLIGSVRKHMGRILRTLEPMVDSHWLLK